MNQMPSPPAMILTEKIRDEACRLGFSRMGVARAGPLPQKELYDRWIAQEMHGQMGFMERQSGKRRNPLLVLETARTILVLAMNYHTEHELSMEAHRGRISRYAWGDDYHDVLKERLVKLESFITHELPHRRLLSYVDTGPVMEKAWGAQTALGWMGKHTNLINRRLGSWFFIGVILLDAELEYDVREGDYCGNCTRCITACPTGAIVAPYVVDARLCISYLTIELRGKIPGPLRPLIGNRIYGCDDCQEVCPWNRFAARTPESRFQPRPDSLNPELATLVDLTPEEFNRRFQGSPVRRAKRDGLVRNVAVALGNSHSKEAVEPLSRALGDRSPLVRAHAAWALHQIDSSEACAALERGRASESDSSVLEEYGPKH